MSLTILSYPDFSKPFILTTDASKTALGAVLSQGEIGSDKPIAFASRTLNKHELNKPIIEKELLAIHWGINYFRPYLYGRKFTVYTDHRPLVSLFTHKNPSFKLTRIRLDLMDYDFEIIFKQGKANTNADALSRIKIDSNELKNMIPKFDINVVTRSRQVKEKLALSNNIDDKEKCAFNKNNNTGNNIISDAETDHLRIWNCTSISDVKNLPKFIFKETVNLVIN